jgi:predicted lipid-binding transport protein (Tim44 family)
MKKFVLLLVLALLSVSLAGLDAQAKRLAGTSGAAKPHNTVTRHVEPAAPPQVPAAPTPAPVGATGLLAGLLAGGVLASLLTGGAFAGIRLADVLMLTLLMGAAFFVLRMWHRKPAAEPLQYVALGAETTPALPARMFGGALHPAPYPLGFEIEPFLRNAKASFIRLQTANDRADLGLIRDYTTPEMFAKLKKRIETRGNEPQQTDIVTLDAEVLDVAMKDDSATASVRFSGLLREKDFGGPARPFYEIWNVQKRLDQPKSVWLLAAIQPAR